VEKNTGDVRIKQHCGATIFAVETQQCIQCVVATVNYLKMLSFAQQYVCGKFMSTATMKRM
jgi:hypothetical protein